MTKGEVGCAENLGIAVLCDLVTADSRFEALRNRILIGIGHDMSKF